MEIRTERRIYCDDIALYVIDRKNQAVGTSVVMEKVERGCITAPTLSLQQTEAQMLMDELWHCGLRPSEGSGSAGAFAAQGKHLEDMRTLVFKEVR